MADRSNASEALDCPVNVTPDDPVISAWRQLSISFYRMQHRLEEMLAPYGLALSQFEALARIGIKPGMIQQDLVALLVVTKGNVGALLDRLENNGLVERRPDKDDRRAKRLYLTTSGRALVTELFAKYRELVRELLKPLSGTQLHQLKSIMEALDLGGEHC